MKKLFNPRHELFAIMLFCHSPVQAGELLVALPDVDYFATNWAREAYRRIRERYASMEISDGVLNFTTLVADDQLSEDTRERLESGRKKFLQEKIDVGEVIHSLSQYRQLRRLNELSEHINTQLNSDEHLDTSVLLSDIKEHMADTEMGHANVKDWFHHMGNEFNLQPVLEAIMSDSERRFIPTGVAAFDENNGGINYGSLWVIGGSTGGGKSLVAQNVSQNMAMYEDVCMVPLEMTEVEMVSRMMAREGKVAIHKITGKKWNQAEKDDALSGLKKFHKKVKKQGNRYTIFRPQADLSIEEILAALHPYNYRAIFIDYIGLLKGADGDDSWQKLGQIARAAKVYAAAYNKVLVLLAQVSEDGKVRYARSILEHANNAWIFVATEHTKEQGIIDVRQPKARNQDPTPFTLDVEYQFMSVTDSDSGSAVGEDDGDEKGTGKVRRPGKSSNDAAKADKRGNGKGGYFDTVDDI